MTMTDTERTVWQLAGLADVHSPDTLTSPGAVFLQRVERATLELVAENEGVTIDDLRDDLAQLADDAVPIYTHEKWQVFVDLCAYQEDLDDLGGTTGDMDKDASVALYIIAERLAGALLEQLAEDDDSEDDED